MRFVTILAAATVLPSTISGHGHHKQASQLRAQTVAGPPLIGAARDKARRRVMERNGSTIIRGQTVHFPAAIPFMPEKPRIMMEGQKVKSEHIKPEKPEKPIKMTNKRLRQTRPSASLPPIPVTTVSAYRDMYDLIPDWYQDPLARGLESLYDEEERDDILEWVPARNVRSDSRDEVRVPASLANLDQVLFDNVFQAARHGTFDSLMHGEGVEDGTTPQQKLEKWKLLQKRLRSAEQEPETPAPQFSN